MRSVRVVFWLMLLAVLAGCGGMLNDLHPSGSDKRPAGEPVNTSPTVSTEVTVTSGTTGTTITTGPTPTTVTNGSTVGLGSAVGQRGPDFTVADSLGINVTLSGEISATSVKGAVLYFTMWCPVCDVHMTHMRDNIMPFYPNVRFYAVDYVSGTVTDARDSEVSNGYDGSGFRVLADVNKIIQNLYPGTMGTTIVIDKTGIVRMNEDFKDGTRLQNILASLP